MTTETADDRVRETAARWADRLMDSDLSAAEREDFQRWLMADESHQREFRAHTVIANLGRDLSEESANELSALALEEHRPARRTWLTALAASLLLGLGIAGWFVYQQAAAPTTHIAAADVARDITLPDGSIAHLNTRTELQWLAGGDERRVALVKGEALFEVRHDAARPFTVVVDGSEIRVLGTRFNVRRRESSDVIVTVLDGTVAVAQPHAAGNTQPWTRELNANEQIVFGANGLIRDVYAATGANAARWREGVLEFEDESLANIVEDLSRYTDRQIVIRDPRVAALRLGGQLNVRDEIQESLGLLEKLAPVTAHESGNAFVLDYQESTEERR